MTRRVATAAFQTLCGSPRQADGLCGPESSEALSRTQPSMAWASSLAAAVSSGSIWGGSVTASSTRSMARQRVDVGAPWRTCSRWLVHSGTFCVGMYQAVPSCAVQPSIPSRCGGAEGGSSCSCCREAGGVECRCPRGGGPGDWPRPRPGPGDWPRPRPGDPRPLGMARLGEGQVPRPGRRLWPPVSWSPGGPGGGDPGGGDLGSHAGVRRPSRSSSSPRSPQSWR